MTESIGTLLSGSWKFFLLHLQTILIASAVLGCLMFGVQKILEVKATGSMEERFGDLDHIEELAERIEAGDPDAFQEMMMQMGMMGDEGEVDEAAVAAASADVMGKMMPIFALVFFSIFVLTMIGSIFFIVLAVEGSTDFMTTLRRVPGLILPMFGVWIWGFLRSFAWIPVLGVIFAIIIGPRLIMSSVILVKEKKGVRESVKLSYKRSRGYWRKIVGNCVVAILVSLLAMLVLSIGVGFSAQVSGALAGLIGAILQGMVTAYGTIFIVRLSNTILNNPLAVVAKK
jgi:hypothetical protein